MAASYPSSIKSFTTKTNNVDDVDASHINDLQEEVVAIETALGAGKATSVLQIVETQAASPVTCATTGTTYDNTTPAITDGVQILSRAITPKSATSKLLFLISFHAACNSGANHTVHLHKDGAAAVKAKAFNIGNHSQECTMICVETSGGTSAQTWTVRLNPSSGGNTSYLNADTSGTQLFNGVSSASIIILELA